MVGMMETFQRYYLPLLIIGFVSGLVALIPKIGLLLGFSVFVLAYRYTQRTTFSGDLLVTLLLWLVVRQLALALHF